MSFLASVRVRLVLTAWVLCTVPFATNVVREHYTAFSLADEFTFRVDRYLGFHPDIFLHTDGHSYVGNNVAVSFIVAIPLFVFDPVLDALERRSLERLDAADGPVVIAADTEGVGLRWWDPATRLLTVQLTLEPNTTDVVPVCPRYWPRMISESPSERSGRSSGICSCTSRVLSCPAVSVVARVGVENTGP